MSSASIDIKKKVLKGIVYSIYAKGIKIIFIKCCLTEQREVYKFNR